MRRNTIVALALAGGMITVDAQASTVRTTGYIAGPAETNRLEIEVIGDKRIYRDAGTTINAVSPCVSVLAAAVCPARPYESIEVYLGNGDDTLRAERPAGSGTFYEIQGDDGNDTLWTDDLGFMIGGWGDDDLTAVEAVVGGPGDDVLRGRYLDDHEGTNELFLTSEGPDTRALLSGGRDTVHGSPFRDVVSYGPRGWNNDHVLIPRTIVYSDATGHGLVADAVVAPDVEEVVGGSAADRIVGGAGANLIDGGLGDDSISGGAGDDSIRGGDGADRLDGGAGADRIEGGSGLDAFFGGAGADSIFSSDGLRERVDCGADVDTVRADEREFLRGCEL